MRIFEFGEYWDTWTFIFFIALGCFISLISKLGAKIDAKSLRLFGKRKKFNVFYILIFICLVLIFTFKDASFGADSITYISIWKRTLSYNFVLGQTSEPLFVLFNFITRKLTDSYTVYFFFVSLIISYSRTKFIREFWNSEHSHLFLMLFGVMFHYEMNIMRSALGVSFLLLSLCSLKKSNRKMAILFSVIATLFHYTLIVQVAFVIFYVVINNRKTMKPSRMWFMVAVACIGMFAIAVFFRENLIGTKYESYVINSKQNLLGHWGVILSVILTIFAYRFKVMNREIDRNIVGLSTIFSCLLLIPTMFLGTYRLTSYYLLPRLAMWDSSLDYFVKGTQENRANKTILCVFGILFYALFTMSRRSDFVGFAIKFVS